MKERLVVVGNGMAGMRTIEELLTIAADKYDITVLGAEPYGNYNRILLSKVLAGEKTLDEIMLNPRHWYEQRGLRLFEGRKIVAVDRRKRRVVAGDGTVEDYDRLLLATGSTAAVIPIPGHDLPGVVTFREIADVHAMLGAVQVGGHAVVIGGGLLGLEAADGLLRRGMQVTVVHLLDHLMERQLDAPAADLLRRALEKRGLEFLLGVRTEAVLGTERVAAVRLDDRRELPADIVVMAVGVRPNIGLAKEAGIYCEQGIVVTDTMQTFDPCIYAVGECVQHRGKTFGLVAPLFKQAKVCANHLAQLGYARYEAAMTSTKLKVNGISLFSAGDYQSGEDCEELVMQDSGQGIYKKLVIRENRVQGAVLYGDTVDEAWYFKLMREGTDVSALRPGLLYGSSRLSVAGHGGDQAAAAMSDDTEVCGCNGVTKGTIVQAITAKGLFTVEEVRAHTKASASCGSCTGLVEQILATTLGGDYSSAPKEKAICKCTDHTHDGVRKAIREQHLTAIAGVMRYLEWRTPDGCPTCRPALNFYVIAAWPGEAQDESRSRFVNERVHANIQRDGTYAVVPRIWGGLTSPAELRAIADCAERFGIPNVKLTGGQRIAIPCIKKEDLPEMYRELGKSGLVSGYAYAKAVRSVKTCVGKLLCRFGTQDTLGLGIRLEKALWGAWTPHKFKLGVSSCPRNCAEATIKDLGVVGVESGWEMHVGGTCGVRVRATDLLCKVKTDDEVVEYGAAFLQLYRDEGRYLERSSAWIERVGLPYVKQRIVEDAEGRRELYARFEEFQRHFQVDPWSEVAEGKTDAREFGPLQVTG